jgi:redox-sensitive bicupin YhaK (pirin superfamily)
MITVRKANDRGHFDHGWLNTFHTFSFAEYQDPDHMGFRVLRVVNEDRVQPGRGFATHAHRDMEILSYVLAGALEHKDSLGNGSVIRPGEVQRMSAGTGVTHSEFNPSASEPVHFLQIWFLPERQGISPGYEQRAFSPDQLRNRLRLVASRDGRDGSVTIHQDVEVYATCPDAKTEVQYEVRPGRHLWVQVARGALRLNKRALEAGDGAALSDESVVRLAATRNAEALVFDLP